MENKNLYQLTAIRFRVDRKEIELTPEQVRRLRDALVELIGPSTGTMPHYHQQPIWIDPNSEYWPDRWEVSVKEDNKASLIINI